MTPTEQKKLKAAITARNKSDDKFRKAVRAWEKASDPNTATQLSLFTKSVDALSEVRALDDDLFGILDKQRTGLTKRVDDELEQLRENLLGAAKKAGCRAVRREKYDYVDCFTIEYKQDRVTLILGSEKWSSFNETDGRRVFDRIVEARSKLDNFPFSRDTFFETVKGAIVTARAKDLGNKSRPGEIPIRKLYPLVVIERQLRDEAFMKQPSAKRFGDYSLCQFVYDLARFGKSDWLSGRGERLCSRTPNMQTIAEGKAVTLPTLDASARGPQLAYLWINRG